MHDLIEDSVTLNGDYVSVKLGLDTYSRIISITARYLSFQTDLLPFVTFKCPSSFKPPGSLMTSLRNASVRIGNTIYLSTLCCNSLLLLYQNGTKMSLVTAFKGKRNSGPGLRVSKKRLLFPTIDI